MTTEQTKRLGVAWVTWVGTRGAAQEMGVSEETIKEWCDELSHASASTPSTVVVPKETDQTAEPSSSRGVRYTPSQKAEALNLVSRIGLARASRETGISVGSLIKWRKESSSTV